MTDAAPRPATLGEVMRRPQFVGLLLLVLVVASVFAFLGRWQLERAIETGTVIERDTETVRPLEELQEPVGYLREVAASHLVTVDGDLVAGDALVVANRVNDGETGWWTVGRLAVTGDGEPGAVLAVALGWAPTEAEAQRAADALNDGGTVSGTFTGRYSEGEGPLVPDDLPADTVASMSIATLVNVWPDVAGAPVYDGFLVVDTPPAGLVAVEAPAPDLSVQPSFLNLFYAVQWVVFGAFAIYIWYRLAKDVVIREREEAEAAQSVAGP